MVRYAKKNQFDTPREQKAHYAQRRYRGSKMANEAVSKQERRYGWGYSKRRHVLLNEE